jgi:hypothetical protein
MSIFKRALVVATATTAATLALAVAPATAGAPPQTGGETATLTITKVVQGDAPADASFTILVSCEASGEHQLLFGAEGGSDSVVFTGPDECDITEPADGGASSTTGLATVQITEPIAYAQTVVNVFDPETPTTPTSEAVSADTATRPTFTG